MWKQNKAAPGIEHILLKETHIFLVFPLLDYEIYR